MSRTNYPQTHNFKCLDALFDQIQVNDSITDTSSNNFIKNSGETFTDNRILRANGQNQIQDSSVSIDDSGNMNLLHGSEIQYGGTGAYDGYNFYVLIV